MVIVNGLTGDESNDLNLDLDVIGDQYIIWGFDNNCGDPFDDFNINFYAKWRHDNP